MPMAKTKLSQGDLLAMKPARMGEVSASLTQAPLGYDQCSVPIAILMADFFMEHMLRLYHRFDRDLLLPIILGQIAHHSVSPVFTSLGQPKAQGDIQHFWDRYKTDRVMAPCNALSLSAATGIPRETVRRKIRQLVRHGWVKQNQKGEVFLTPKPTQDFVPAFNVVTLNRLLQTSQRIQRMLAEASHSAIQNP